MVEVEQRALRSLEEDALAVVERPVDEQRGVGDERPQPLGEALVARGDVVQLERLLLVDALQPDVLLGERDLDLLPQDLGIEQVLDPDPEPCRLVGVRGTDPTARRPDLQLAEPLLARAVDDDVPGHDQVRVAGDPQRLSRDSAALEVVDLVQQHRGVDDAAGPEHAHLPERIPDGRWRNLNVSPATMTVCPAFGPPW